MPLLELKGWEEYKMRTTKKGLFVKSYLVANYEGLDNVTTILGGSPSLLKQNSGIMKLLEQAISYRRNSNNLILIMITSRNRTYTLLILYLQ